MSTEIGTRSRAHLLVLRWLVTLGRMRQGRANLERSRRHLLDLEEIHHGHLLQQRYLSLLTEDREKELVAVARYSHGLSVCDHYRL